MGCWITGQLTGVQRDAGPGQPLHEWHRRIAVDIRPMKSLFFQHAKYARWCRVSFFAGRYRRLREQRAVGVDRDPLIGDRDHDLHRPGRHSDDLRILSRRLWRLPQHGALAEPRRPKWISLIEVIKSEIEK